ncbi:hypothetical protein ACOSQ3_002889 [Xanthoceras sorbifolium]
MVSLGKDVRNEVASDQLQHGQSPDRGSPALEENHVGGIRASQSDKDGSTPLNMPKKESLEPDTRSDQQGSISSIKSEKALETTDIIQASQSGPEGSSPSIIREKVSEDGYNWRKYGQKLVRANEFIRSYYKCTHPNCRVKKQLDCTHDGHITDIIYFGQHDHPKLPNLPLAVGVVVSIVEERPDDSSLSVAKDKSSDTHGQTPHKIEPTTNPQLSVAASDDAKPLLQSNRIKYEVNDDAPGSKRQKKENPSASATLVDKSTGEQRFVVQTFSEIDIVNDGYRWRKYGQKLVKGNPNPRNYYRCSSSRCPVKKHVERASHDPKLVITTYEGRHDHDMPPSRTVTHNTGGQNSATTGHNDESGTKLEENNAVCLDMVVHSGPGPSEQLNGESRTKSEVTGIIGGSEIVNKSSSVPENKSTEQQNGKSGTNTVEENDVGHNTIAHDSSHCDDRSNDQLNGESGTETEQNSTACHDTVVRVTPCPETSFSEQEPTPNPEPVRT